MHTPLDQRPPRASALRRGIAALVLALIVVSACGPATTPDGWALTWSDEFEGAAGTGLNTGPDGWIYDIGHGYGCPDCPDNWGTGEIAYMTDSTDNVYHDGAGNLAIKPTRAGEPGAYTWTSGRIETQRTDFQPAPGGLVAFEARIQLPNMPEESAKGYWAAFWALGAPFRGVYTNWPGIGEIDILENVNGANSWWGTLHCGTAPGGPCNETNGLGSGAVSGWEPTLQEDFHIYRLEWDRSTEVEELRWYVDGQQTHRVRASQVDATTWANATGHGYFLILNVAIGGGWPGLPNDQTVPGVPMLVDYVRVYNR